jgi:putative transposase
VQLRREAAQQLTTKLAGSYGHIVIEDLDLAAMKKGMGRRAFRRAASDAAIGVVRPQLAYKTARCGGILTVADPGSLPARSTTVALHRTAPHAG